MEENRMQIKEIEKITGITTHNIRYYEKEHLISPTRNPMNGYREYSQDDIERLNTIKMLRMLHVPVKSIREYFEEKTSLKQILTENFQNLQKEEQDIRKSRMLNKCLLEYVDTIKAFSEKDSSELLSELFENEEFYIQRLEQVRKQDVWKAVKFTMGQVLCIIGGVLEIVFSIVFFFSAIAPALKTWSVSVCVSFLAVLFVLIIRSICENEKRLTGTKELL